jgi:predicted O-methyltransferase YrrM
MGLLFDLADKYNTDKRWQDHGYVLIYEQLMESKRLTTNKMLEIGFGGGASARMWREYFPNADIYCMEYKDEEYKDVWNSPELEIEDVDLIIGDSTKVESWNEIPYELDFIVDDGSHFSKDQMATFMLGFPHVKSGGLYIVEDLHCTFEERYGATDDIYKWVFNMIMEQQTPGRNYGGNFYQCRGAMPEIVRDIYSYQFTKSLIIFQKA